MLAQMERLVHEAQQKWKTCKKWTGQHDLPSIKAWLDDCKQAIATWDALGA